MVPKKRKKLIIFFVCIIIMILIINVYCQMKNSIEISNQNKVSILMKKAEYMENNVISGGKTYYISSSGTSNTGTDINSPMSLETANTKTFYGNDRILLKRGDIFYGILNFNIKAESGKMVYIGCYGNENYTKPIISGKTIVVNNNAWTLYNNDIYRIDLSDSNSFEGLKGKSFNPYNVGFLKDANGNIYANRKSSKELLNLEYDFYCEDNYLYVKSQKPPKDFSFTTQVDLVKVTSNTIIKDLIIEDTGAHGISIKEYLLKNVYIENCLIRNIGGSVLRQDTFTRYGNGIEFWAQAENTIVNNCIIYNIYDAGYTLQGDGVTDGFNNNICQNNIFINCTYPIELFCHNNLNIDNCGFENNVVKNNIIINQGQGFGYETRPDKFQPANLVTWILPYPEVKFEYTNNRIYNSRALYYKGVNAAEDMYSRCINADNNLYYVTSKTKYFLDVNKYQDLEYMYSQGLDLNSTFNYLSDSEIEEISNEEILNSNDYDEIKAYYDNFDNKYRNSHWVQDTTSSIDEIMNEDEYNNLLENSTINTSYTELKNAIGKLSQNVDTISQDSVSYSYECLYNFINTIVSEYNNNSISIDENKLLELIEKLDNISEKYKEIYSYYITEDSIGLDTVKNDLNNTIDKYNNNLDLDIGSLENIIIKIKDLYNNSITTDNVYENVLNKNRIIYITNIVNSIIDSKINNFVAEEKGKIQVEFDRDIYEPTNQNITVTLITGDSTKITNNEGSNKYTFYENGKFIFELDIKGVKVSVEVTIANINKDYTIEDGYISNISNNTLANTLKEELNLNNYTIWHNGNELDLSKDIISTGDILKYDNKEYTLIVNGDVDKDGDCGIRDLVSLRKYLLDYTKYDIIEEMAADTNQDDSLDIKDLVGMRKIILN